MTDSHKARGERRAGRAGGRSDIRAGGRSDDRTDGRSGDRSGSRFDARAGGRSDPPTTGDRSDARAGGRSRPRPRAGGRRRKRARRARLVLILGLSFLVLLVAGAGWIYFRLDGNITTFDADGVSGDRPEAGAGGSNVLVIGSDSRSGGNQDLGGGEGEVGRSDTAFLLHVYADRKHAVAVSLPRDTLVDIPPCRLPDGSWTKPRTSAMFNSAFSVGETAHGNPACTQNTVEKLTGLRVDHTVVVDFAGFAKMTSAVGGVPVCVPKDVYEGDLNPHRGSRGNLVLGKGPQTVSGRKALDYVRIRHGIGDGSDIGRIKRQQTFVSGLFKKVKEEGLNPTTLLPLANAATESLTVDPGLGSAAKLLAFAMSMKDIDLHDIKFLTLPWRYQGNRVAIVQPDADALWAALKADRTVDGKDAGGPSKGDGNGPASSSPSPTPRATVSGAGIAVAVYNGTTVRGLGARATDALKDAGFTVTHTATATTQDHTGTLVTYGPGEKNQAETVAQLFPGSRLEPAATAGVVITLGQSYADERPETGTTPSATPTDLPARLADAARSADDDPCSDLSYG
ncbi:LCP family protein [Streptomyces sp. NPDC003077]|uniref:LCP family protein n=1 Tax=Streptomyces sp. NPDC003077 TaxID=3154443 RepID=UPI0033A99088